MEHPGNVGPLLERGITVVMREHLRATAVLASERGVPLYLVGGTVRDLFLGLPHGDLDVTVEGDALALARAVAEQLGGKTTVHERFGTATVALPDGSELDFATARAESYPRPGALPVVRPGSLAQDLARRDFSCNAMAVRVDGDAWGACIDPFGGYDDLSARLIRVLHDRSFEDDPTRLFRAVRYAGRLGFAIESRTWDLMLRDAGALATLTGDRIRHELELIFLEPHLAPALALAQTAGLLAPLAAELPRDHGLATAFTDFGAELLPDIDRRAAGFALLAWTLDLPRAGEFARRLNLSPHQTNAVLGAVALRQAEEALAARDMPPSAVASRLGGYPAASVVALAVRSSLPLAAERAARYLREWRHIRPELSGRDLIAMGVAQGPALGRLLQRVREARLDLQAESRDDEMRLVREWLQSSPEAATTDGD